jgi:hypothetical protein
VDLPAPPPLTQSLKIRIFLCVKHLRSVWAADAPRYSPFLQPISQFSPHIYLVSTS